MATPLTSGTVSVSMDHFLREQPLPRRNDFLDYWRATAGSNADEFRDVARKLLEAARDNSSPELHVRAGLVAYLLGDHDAALAHLKSAGDDPTALFLKGLTLLTLDQLDEARTAFAQAANAGFDRADAVLKQAEATRRMGNLEEAEQLVRSTGREAVGRADYSYQLGCILMDHGDFHGGIEYFERAANIEPLHTLALFRLATIAAARSDELEAIELYERCLSIPPIHLGALINLGLLYEDVEQYRAAEYCFRRALEYDPQNERAQLYLKDIEATGSMYYDEDSNRRALRRQHLLSRPIVDFELSVRSRNCLQAMNIETLGDLTRTSEAELLGGKNFGETSLQEVSAMMKSHGLEIGEDLVEQPASGRPPQPSQQTELTPEEQRVSQMSIAELNLSVRARKCMTRLGITTVGELITRTPDELLQTRNFGVTSLNEVRQKLGELNLSLRND